MKLYSVIKLNNGEEIFAKIAENVDEGSPVLLIEDPLVQEEIFHDDGNSSVLMTRYCHATSERKIPLIKSAIVALTSMSPAFKEYYKAAVRIAELSSKSYDARLTQLTEAMYFQLSAIKQANNQLAFSVIDTDTIH